MVFRRVGCGLGLPSGPLLLCLQISGKLMHKKASPNHRPKAFEMFQIGPFDHLCQLAPRSLIWGTEQSLQTSRSAPKFDLLYQVGENRRKQGMVCFQPAIFFCMYASIYVYFLYTYIKIYISNIISLYKYHDHTLYEKVRFSFSPCPLALVPVTPPPPPFSTPSVCFLDLFTPQMS